MKRRRFRSTSLLRSPNTSPLRSAAYSATAAIDRSCGESWASSRGTSSASTNAGARLGTFRFSTSAVGFGPRTLPAFRARFQPVRRSARSLFTLSGDSPAFALLCKNVSMAAAVSEATGSSATSAPSKCVLNRLASWRRPERYSVSHHESISPTVQRRFGTTGSRPSRWRRAWIRRSASSRFASSRVRASPSHTFSFTPAALRTQARHLPPCFQGIALPLSLCLLRAGARVQEQTH
ncbi:MAG: hypothetical protein ACJ79P_00130 [Myxococcales bacterium]